MIFPAEIELFWKTIERRDWSDNIEITGQIDHPRFRGRERTNPGSNGGDGVPFVP